jgi:predicted small lipoprotein YifL
MLLAALAMTLGSCGRKGPLEPDPSSQLARPPDGEPGDGKGTEAPHKAAPRPFPLDPML